SSVHISEELHALDSGHWIAGGRGRGYLAAGFSGRNGTALEEIQLSILERPFDITPRTVDLLALQGELAQGGEVSVVEAELVYLLGWDLLFEGSTVRERADRNALAARLALQHLARAVDAEMVGNNEAGDDGLTEAPAGFDHALVGASNRILGKHD